MIAITTSNSINVKPREEPLEYNFFITNPYFSVEQSKESLTFEMSTVLPTGRLRLLNWQFPSPSMAGVCKKQESGWLEHRSIEIETQSQNNSDALNRVNGRVEEISELKISQFLTGIQCEQRQGNLFP